MASNHECRATDAVILLAGAGSRLITARGSVPKPLVPIAGQPLISHVLRALKSVGIQRVHGVVGANAEEVIDGIEACLPDGIIFIPIHNPEWRKQNGVSVLAAAHALERPFVLAMGDHLVAPEILQELIAHADYERLNLAVDRNIERIFDLADATKVRTAHGKIVEIGKDLTTFDAIDTGVFFCPTELFDYLERAKTNGDCSLSDGVRLMARDGKAAAIDIGDQWWQDVDTPAMLRRAEQELTSFLREDWRGLPEERVTREHCADA